MIIDAHQHFWDPARGDYGWMENEAAAPLSRPYLPQDYATLRAEFGVDRTVLVQAAPTLVETDYLLSLADGSDIIAGVVGWIDFEQPADIATLHRFAQHPKFLGLRPMIQDIPDVNWMLQASVQWAFQVLIDHDLTFDALGFVSHTDNFVSLLKRYPELRAVIDHALKPQIKLGEFNLWADGMSRLAETKAYCKLSGLITEASTAWHLDDLKPYVDHILTCFGPNRVMWGSDWPVLNLNGSYGRWWQAAHTLVPHQHHTAVFGETAQRFYRLSNR